MKLLDIYTAVLEAAGCTVDDEGYVSSIKGETPTPVLIDGKRLAIPTDTRLESSGDDGVVILHPFNENLMRTGESPIMEMLRKHLSLAINARLIVVMTTLMSLAGDSEKDKTLSPHQSEFLKVLTKINKSTLTNFLSLLKAKKSDLRYKFLVSFFNTRPAKFGEASFSRGCVVNFPLYQELIKVVDGNEKDPKIDGVSIRATNCKLIADLLQSIFPGVATEHHYSRGSNSMLAPVSEGMLKAVRAIVTDLNNVVTLFKDHLPEDTHTVDTWFDAVTNLTDLEREVKVIPPQAGNEAPVIKKAQTKTEGNTRTATIDVDMTEPELVGRINSTPATSARDERSNDSDIESDREERPSTSATPGVIDLYDDPIFKRRSRDDDRDDYRRDDRRDSRRNSRDRGRYDDRDRRNDRRSASEMGRFHFDTVPNHRDRSSRDDRRDDRRYSRRR